MRTIVVGAGAMGSYVAARLALAEAEVALYGRPSAHLERIADRGLALGEPDGTGHLTWPLVTSDPAFAGVAELAIVLVKTWATAEALAPLRPYLPLGTAVLTLQNGLANAEAIGGALGRDPGEILVGATTEAALRDEPGHVRHTGRGETAIGRADGRPDPRVAAAARLLSGAAIPTDAVGDVNPRLWRKLAVSAAVNAVTALAGVPNGAVADDPELRAVALELAREAAAVARAVGAEPGDVEGAVLEVARATAANRSSMLGDLEAGNPTEADAINGAVVAHGERTGVPTPANRLVLALLRARGARPALREAIRA